MILQKKNPDQFLDIHQERVMKTTIDDIAKAAGVGVGTVSRVLNGNIHVSDSTRSKVLSTVRELDYMPSSAAARLARKHFPTCTIGLLMPDIGNHFFFEIFEEIYKESRRQGINLLLFNYERHDTEIISRILDTDVSMLLIFNFQLDKEEKELITSRNIQFFSVDSPSLEDRCMYTDNSYGGKLAAAYLLSFHIHHPCYIADIHNSQSSCDREEGFSLICKQNGIDSILKIACNLSEEAGYEAGKVLITQGICDGVFCFCDEIAAGVIEAKRAYNSTIHVIGFDGLQISRHLQFSTISQNPTEIGRYLFGIINQFLHGNIKQTDVIQKKIVPTLINRNS